MKRILPLSLLCATVFSMPLLAGEKKSSDTVGASQDKRDENAIDISDVKDKLMILHDGKQHYIAVIPFGDAYTHLYYGDGRRFYALRVQGGSRSGDEQWDRGFWEPRVNAGWKATVGFAKQKYSVQCGERATELSPISADEQSKMLASASFSKPLWTHKAYALSRDDKGNYYYVDRLREPENNKSFRLFAGPRGNLKLLKMTNVVSDSQGDIFSTKKGELRLILDRKRSTWIAGKSQTELTNVPVEDNHILIYTDLGVYAGQRLGTPCDDLL